MALIREVPSPATIADVTRAVSQRDINRRAITALDRRLDQLEHQRQALTAGAHGCEKATLMLGPEDRATALRRLRHITADIPLQLDVFQELRASLDEAA
jgi:hypothetical protein